jgi:hypothetical protein
MFHLQDVLCIVALHYLVVTGNTTSVSCIWSEITVANELYSGR